MSIQSTIKEITEKLPQGVKLVAVSKYHPAEMIQEAYKAGQRIFGESHVQELQTKVPTLPSDIEWHFIGHLQTNKIKYIAPYIHLIHAVDSLRLLQEINKQAERNNRIIKVLLQLHVAQEETKYGFTESECDTLLENGEWRNMKNIEIAGIMCMASNVDDNEQITHEFQRAHNYFVRIRNKFFADSPAFCECSMGMSEDYPIAVENGSTMIRVGTKIFGPRSY